MTANVYALSGWCSLDGRIDCDLCDECDHPAADHINGHDQAGDVAQLIFDRATCWSENVCRQCDPALHYQVAALAATR